MLIKVRDFLFLLLGSVILTFFVYRIVFLEIAPYRICDIHSPVKICSVFLLLLFTIILAVNQFISLLFENPPTILQRVIFKFLLTFFYNPLTLLATYLLSFKEFIMFCEISGVSLYHLIKTKVHLILFVILFFIMPRIIYGLSIYADVIYLEKVHLILKNVVIISYSLMMSAFLAFINIHYQNKKTRLERDHIIVQVQGDKIMLYPKSKHTMQSDFDSWDWCILVLDRLDAIKVLRQSKIISLFSFLFSFFLIYCLLNYITLLLHSA